MLGQPLLQLLVHLALDSLTMLGAQHLKLAFDLLILTIEPGNRS